jgi:uncharacterized protein
MTERSERPGNRSGDLRARLRNLRAVNTHTQRRFDPSRNDMNDQSYRDFGDPQPLETLVPGDLHETPLGTSYVIRTLHTLDHAHGSEALNSWLDRSLAGAAAFTRDPRLATVDPRRCLFLDTETTGLGGGAGTLVFLVGVGLFTDDGFEVRQYFLRNPAEEPAMLHAIQDLLARYDALVTFNGRSFDVPLLSMRYVVNQQATQVDRWPNLDLLHPARRLWKRRLESCRLAALETAILGVQRTNADVPGWLIPQLYHEFLQSGDARQMARVVYHNLIDVLSMVTLATHLCGIFMQSDLAEIKLPHDDLLSLARWYDGLGMIDQAEQAYRATLSTARHDFDRAITLESLAALYKRQERRADAVQCWESLAALVPSNLTARLELSKYHEWTTGDIGQAMEWTKDALRIVMSGPQTPGRESALDDLMYRMERLKRKQR